jgi:hypothetical protein
MLNFDPNWRFDSPGEIAPGVVDDFLALIRKIIASLNADSGSRFSSSAIGREGEEGHGIMTPDLDRR